MPIAGLGKNYGVTHPVFQAPLQEEHYLVTKFACDKFFTAPWPDGFLYYDLSHFHRWADFMKKE